MTDTRWTVHKFGGGSLAGEQEFRNVTRILMARESERRAVVVSAMGGITDRLFDLVRIAEEGEPYEELVADVRERHVSVAGDLLPEADAKEYVARLDSDLADVEGVLRATSLLRAATPEAESLVSGFGEIWSSRLLAAVLRASGAKAVSLNARDALIVRHTSLGPSVQWDTSRERLLPLLPEDNDTVVVITGYVALSTKGAPTTLGRNGSDYSASIFGALLDAREVNIWTDVDGVMSGDPRLVPDAAVIPELSYHEAMELAYFGAKVIHPKTMEPAVSNDIPLYIRNTFRPALPGTRISAEARDDRGIKGLTSITDVAVVNLEGAGMIGVPGTAQRLFGALSNADISVILISQGSSEHSICCAVPEMHGQAAAEVVREAFEDEIRRGQIQGVKVAHDCSIIAVVGEGMRGSPGVAGMLFQSLSRAGINVLAIAQGASQRNISAVVNRSEVRRALRVVHAGFYLSPQTVSVGIIGPGSVGTVLLNQLAGEMARLQSEINLDIRIRGITNSRGMLLADHSLQIDNWQELHARSAVPTDLDAFVDHIQADHLPHAVLVDCTASNEIAAKYTGWLERGIHVVTPNKKGCSASMEFYNRLRVARRAGGARFLYETTVGAGLPIIETLRDLRLTGDVVERIDGILSGTLAYLFNKFDGSEPFSSIVRTARERGYTEPDPRDDLMGMDVARKVVILGREMGLDLELEDVEVESLVPDALLDCSVDEFLDGFAEYDDAMAKRFDMARRAGKKLRYVGRLGREGEATVRLEQVDDTDSLAHIVQTDNLVQFVTRRYNVNPLIVRGPGAGPDVTAAGVFSDLLRLSTFLGANL